MQIGKAERVVFGHKIGTLQEMPNSVDVFITMLQITKHFSQKAAFC